MYFHTVCLGQAFFRYANIAFVRVCIELCRSNVEVLLGALCVAGRTFDFGRLILMKEVATA